MYTITKIITKDNPNPQEQPTHTNGTTSSPTTKHLLKHFHLTDVHFQSKDSQMASRSSQNNLSNEHKCPTNSRAVESNAVWPRALP